MCRHQGGMKPIPPLVRGHPDWDTQPASATQFGGQTAVSAVRNIERRPQLQVLGKKAEHRDRPPPPPGRYSTLQCNRSSTKGDFCTHSRNLSKFCTRISQVHAQAVEEKSMSKLHQRHSLNQRKLQTAD